MLLIKDWTEQGSRIQLSKYQGLIKDSTDQGLNWTSIKDSNKQGSRIQIKKDQGLNCTRIMDLTKQGSRIDQGLNLTIGSPEDRGLKL